MKNDIKKLLIKKGFNKTTVNKMVNKKSIELSQRRGSTSVEQISKDIVYYFC